MSDRFHLDLGYDAQIAQRFATAFGDKFDTGVPLAKYTASRVGGPADMVVTVQSAEELQACVELALETDTRFFILGGGSNILISDRGVRGLVIFNKAKKIQFRNAGAALVCTAESGVNLASLARQCISKGLAGLEWAIGVPGTVGGAVIGNSGAHGGDMNDNVVAATIWEPGRGVKTYSIDELKFGYRTSTLKKDQTKLGPRRVVLSAELRFEQKPTEQLFERAEEFTIKRKATQPGGASTGSMFKNPENYYAGYLIEAAGLKGMTSGGAQISEKHANFFINNGNATAEDIRTLVAEAWHTVKDRFGVEMDLEVELVGDWKFD